MGFTNGITTPTLDLEHEWRAWSRGYRGARTVWVPDAPEYLMMYVPNVKVGEVAAWPLHPFAREGLSSFLPDHEIARIAGESDLYDDCGTSEPVRGFRGTLVSVGVVYSPNEGHEHSARLFIWRQFTTSYPEFVKDRSGEMYLARGALCDFDYVTELDADPGRWWDTTRPSPTA